MIDVKLLYPIGSIYMSIQDTNPSVFFGGTWERIAKGKTLVGVDENDTDFNISSKTGGEKTHTLTIDEIPKHNHRDFYQVKDGASSPNNGGSYSGRPMVKGNNASNNTEFWNTADTGGDQPHNNMQPYYTCYIFVRTA